MAKAKIVVTDGYTLNPGDNPWDTVAALGELTIYERSAANEVVDRCREARRRLMTSTAENIRAFLDGVPRNIVNAMHLASD